MVLVAVGLAAWFAWASQRPGGVSGTVDSWIAHVRGDVAKVSADPDLSKAIETLNAQYAVSSGYAQLSDVQLLNEGIGVGVAVLWCSPQAVVVQGATGGGTSSHLLISGHDVGGIDSAHACPADLSDPSPWNKTG